MFAAGGDTASSKFRKLSEKDEDRKKTDAVAKSNGFVLNI